MSLPAPSANSLPNLTRDLVRPQWENPTTTQQYRHLTMIVARHILIRNTRTITVDVPFIHHLSSAQLAIVPLIWGMVKLRQPTTMTVVRLFQVSTMLNPTLAARLRRLNALPTHLKRLRTHFGCFCGHFLPWPHSPSWWAVLCSGGKGKGTELSLAWKLHWSPIHSQGSPSPETMPMRMKYLTTMTTAIDRRRVPTSAKGGNTMPSWDNCLSISATTQINKLAY